MSEDFERQKREQEMAAKLKALQAEMPLGGYLRQETPEEKERRLKEREEHMNDSRHKLLVAILNAAENPPHYIFEEDMLARAIRSDVRTLVSDWLLEFNGPKD